MKRLSIATMALAVVLCAPASAQRLGGGLGGGLGGNLGGGAMGQIGGKGGTIGGGLNTTLGDTRTMTDAATQARADARAADRASRRAAARQRKQGGQPDATGSVAFSGNGSIADRMIPGAGGSADAHVNLDAAGMRTPGIDAAMHRGMQRVARTATGVPVFVAAPVGAAVVVATRPVAPYPVYQRGVYYGGGTAVFLSAGEVGGYMDRQYDDLRQDLRGTGATVFRRGNDLVLQLPADVTFAFDKSDIQPRFYGTLSAVAHTLDAYRATDVEIVGHTDSIGTQQYNLGLSERRGRSVADFLVYRAADPSRLVVEAMGKAEPIASNATIQGRAANRRVEIIFHPRMD